MARHHDLDVDTIVARYEAGDSMQVIADDLGCSYITIRKQVLDAGVTMRPSGTPEGER